MHRGWLDVYFFRPASTSYIVLLPLVLGLVQNMSDFVCPQCGHHTAIFGESGAVRVAEEIQVDVIGNISDL